MATSKILKNPDPQSNPPPKFTITAREFQKLRGVELQLSGLVDLLEDSNESVACLVAPISHDVSSIVEHCREVRHG